MSAESRPHEPIPLPDIRRELRSQLRPLLLALPILTLLTGIAYPIAVGVIARPMFPDQAAGSLIVRDGKVTGSKLIAQGFVGPGYFHPRPSAAGAGYDGASSGGTNLGPAHPKLRDGLPDDPATEADESFVGVRQLAAQYRRENGLGDDALVPIDAVTRSGSGLDPHISPENAALQADRVAGARDLAPALVRDLIARHTLHRQLGIFGQPRVAVLELNLALDDATLRLERKR